jgi:molybdopterin converting factor small subunit
MSVRVTIPSPLLPFSGGRGAVELAGARTVRDALESLGRLYPGVRDRVLTEQGALRPHVNIFVGDESIRFLEGLATRLPDDCEVAILPALSGG